MWSSHRGVQNASAVLNIFAHQAKETFSTQSAPSRHAAANLRYPLPGGKPDIPSDPANVCEVDFGGTKLASARSLLLPAKAQPQEASHREGDMSRSRLALITMMILSMGFVLYPQDSAHAARYCAQVRGTTVGGQPDCSFSTMDACRARVKHRGGGHCYRLTHPT